MTVTVLMPMAMATAAVGALVWRARRRRTVFRRLAPAGRPAPGSERPVRFPESLVQAFRDRDRARRRSSELLRAAPLVAELVRMAVTAGLPPAGAVRHVAPWAPGVAGTELDRVVADFDAGLTAREALDALRARAVELRGLVRVLQASADLGTEVGVALDRLARDQREALRRAAETRARTVPVRLLFPLVFLVLPAFVMLGVVPALLAGSAS